MCHLKPLSPFLKMEAKFTQPEACVVQLAFSTFMTDATTSAIGVPDSFVAQRRATPARQTGSTRLPSRASLRKNEEISPNGQR